jgi:hypothetical protein
MASLKIRTILARVFCAALSLFFAAGFFQVVTARKIHSQRWGWISWRDDPIMVGMLCILIGLSALALLYAAVWGIRDPDA